MKKVLLLTIGLLLFLIACGPKETTEPIEEDDPIEKKDEMTETTALHYLEEVTYRYVNASELPVDSFEQTSELQAGVSRSESIIEEIESEYATEEGLPKEIIELAKLTKEACQDILDGNYDADYDNSFAIGEKLGQISSEYLDGEMPPTIKHKVMNE